MRILITRPIEDSQRTVEALQALGYEALVAPLFRINPLPYGLPQKPDMLFATSANAIRSCEKNAFAPWHAMPFLTVGDATAKAATEYGFSNVISAGADSVALAAMIRVKAKLGASLLQLAGKPRRDAAIQALQGDYLLSTIETYETIACSQLPDAIAQALVSKSIHTALHFSPRASTVFMDLVNARGLTQEAGDLRHICISAAAKDPRFIHAIIAAQPTLRSMIKAVSAG